MSVVAIAAVPRATLAENYGRQPAGEIDRRKRRDPSDLKCDAIERNHTACPDREWRIRQSEAGPGVHFVFPG